MTINNLPLELARNLVEALEQGDESASEKAMDEILASRESQLYQEVGRLTRQLHDTMASFSLDAKLSSMTENDIPDAKERLQYVIKTTEQAANQTLTAVENLLSVSEELNQQAEKLSEKWALFLDKQMPFAEFKNMSTEITQHFQHSRTSLQQVQQGLNGILLAQGFQDITGQVIKKVIEMVQELETSMVELVRLSSGQTTQSKAVSGSDLAGPVVPGVDDNNNDVATNQDEVDDLLLSLGF